MHRTNRTAHSDRRDSLRVVTRLYVRGLGDDRDWSDRLGNLSLGGVGFEFPRAPDAERFQVVFSCPGESRMRRAVAEVIDYDPLEGTRDRDDPFYVRLRFERLQEDDERAMADCFRRMAFLPSLGYAGPNAGQPALSAPDSPGRLH